MIAIVFCCFLDKLVFQNLARGRFNIKINRHLSPKYFDGVQTLADGIKQIFPDRMIVPGQELVIKTTQGCVSGDEIGHFYLFHKKVELSFLFSCKYCNIIPCATWMILGCLNLRDTQFNDNYASFTSIV